MTDAPERTSRTAYVVWSVAVAAFSVTAMQRTTLGVAGLEASERLSATPTELSALLLLQTTVFLVLNLPAGALVDRWGPRRCLALGASLAAAGQVMVALAVDLGPVVAGRVLVGAADAVVLVAALTLVPRWFSGPQVPLITQLTTLSGQAGQVLSAVPFLALLQLSDWTVAFSSAAALGVLVAILALALVRDAPQGRQAPSTERTAPVAARLRAVWRRPGTRLGYATHLVTQFPMMTFALLWGVPYLVSGQDLSTRAAGALFSLMAVATFAAAPAMGLLVARLPHHRVGLVLAVVGLTSLTWTAVLLTPPPTPRWMLVVLMLVLALGGPASVVGFDLARTANPPADLGLAQSVVNTGGFTASLVVLLAVGVVVDLAGGYGPDSFRMAWLTMYPVWIGGVIAVAVLKRRVTTTHP